jgi:hypothetical protein
VVGEVVKIAHSPKQQHLTWAVGEPRVVTLNKGCGGKSRVLVVVANL